MKDADVSIKIGKKTFLTAVAILAVLMLIAGILTQVVPAGSYQRVVDGGREIIDPDSFSYMPRADYPAWRWLTAPVEVLGGPDGPMVIVIILFILSVAGAFSLLEGSGVLAAVILKIVRRFEKRKYILMSVIVLLFMFLGAVLGTFEENIALVPIIIALACFLGWDSLTGLGMSILASCFGFAAAITNPFSIAITQKLAGLPLYSGMGFRVLIFITFFLMLELFLIRYAKKIEKNPGLSPVYKEDAPLRAKYSRPDGMDAGVSGSSGVDQRRLNCSILCFSGILALILLFVVFSSVTQILSDLVLPVIGLLFLAGGIISSALAGTGLKTGWVTFRKAIGGILPGAVLILMAMSVKFIISQGGIMDTILNRAASLISGTTPYAAVFLLYLLVLLLEVFIGSSSAKAFLVMPIIAPLSDLTGITRQTSVLAFCFGDGFSNVLYPTNPVLLICLGLTVVSYTRWLKWTIKLQLVVFAVSLAFLALATAIGFGPY